MLLALRLGAIGDVRLLLSRDLTGREGKSTHRLFVVKRRNRLDNRVYDGLTGSVQGRADGHSQEGRGYGTSDQPKCICEILRKIIQHPGLFVGKERESIAW